MATQKEIDDIVLDRLRKDFELLTEKEQLLVRNVVKEMRKMHDNFDAIIGGLSGIHKLAEASRHNKKLHGELGRHLAKHISELEEYEVETNKEVNAVKLEITKLMDYARKLHTLENWLIAFERRCEIDVFRK